MSSISPDLVVVGGGLAGLSVAALVARAGRSVLVLEQSSHLGGRAITQVRNGVHFNLGPHALYVRGHAFRLFRELGLPFTGQPPRPTRALLTRGQREFGLPGGLFSVLFSRLLTWREKARFLRLFLSLPALDPRPFDRVALSAWIEQSAGRGGLADLLGVLFRVSTYANDPGHTSAGAALDQLKLALAGNVWYLDGGWQTLVDGLRDRAVGWGAQVRSSARALFVRADEEGVMVSLAGGEEVSARAAVLAVPPRTAVDLLDLPRDAALSRWVARALPVRAASLDVALSRLPRPNVRVAFGLDRPLYYSVHSAVARLGPDGVAVLHTMKYLGQEERASEEELTGYLDQLQPGWRDHVVQRRFLPAIAVANALPMAEEGGLAGRPGGVVSEHPNVFLAGDWVGERGMLADAVAASAEECARRVLATLRREDPAHV